MWLCRSCARIIDTDPSRFPASLLHHWKADAETSLLVAYNIASEAMRPPTDFDFESDFNLQRVINIRFGFSFLAPEAWGAMVPPER